MIYKEPSHFLYTINLRVMVTIVARGPDALCVWFTDTRTREVRSAIYEGPSPGLSDLMGKWDRDKMARDEIGPDVWLRERAVEDDDLEELGVILRRHWKTLQAGYVKDLSFSYALVYMKRGCNVRRAAWNQSTYSGRAELLCPVDNGGRLPLPIEANLLWGDSHVAVDLIAARNGESPHLTLEDLAACDWLVEATGETSAIESASSRS